MLKIISMIILKCYLPFSLLFSHTYRVLQRLHDIDDVIALMANKTISSYIPRF